MSLVPKAQFSLLELSSCKQKSHLLTFPSCPASLRHQGNKTEVCLLYLPILQDRNGQDQHIQPTSVNPFQNDLFSTIRINMTIFVLKSMVCKKFYESLQFSSVSPIMSHKVSLKRSYGVLFFFQFCRLRSELCIQYSHEQFAKNTVSELLKYNRLLESDLHTGLPEIHKLMNLVMTIPIATASVERSFSGLKRIKSYLRSSQSEERLSNLSLISIERHILIKLMGHREKFYGMVIEEFCKKTRRVEFLFK